MPLDDGKDYQHLPDSLSVRKYEIPPAGVSYDLCNLLLIIRKNVPLKCLNGLKHIIAVCIQNIGITGSFKNRCVNDFPQYDSRVNRTENAPGIAVSVIDSDAKIVYISAGILLVCKCVGYAFFAL